MVFVKPDEKTIARLTVHGIGILLSSLRERRKNLTVLIDEEIKFYEELEKKKRGDNNAETTR